MLNTVTASFANRVARSLAVLALCAGSVAQAQTAPSRVGFVSTERLITESKLSKAADAKIEAEFSKRQKAIQENIARFKAMSDKYDSEALTLSEPERTKRARELLDMDKDVQRQQREFREDLITRKSEERTAIWQRAHKVVEQIAEQEKLDVVLVEAFWFSNRVDLTDRVLKQLDK